MSQKVIGLIRNNTPEAKKRINYIFEKGRDSRICDNMALLLGMAKSNEKAILKHLINALQAPKSKCLRVELRAPLQTIYERAKKRLAALEGD